MKNRPGKIVAPNRYYLIEMQLLLMSLLFMAPKINIKAEEQNVLLSYPKALTLPEIFLGTPKWGKKSVRVNKIFKFFFNFICHPNRTFK